MGADKMKEDSIQRITRKMTLLVGIFSTLVMLIVSIQMYMGDMINFFYFNFLLMPLLIFGLVGMIFLYFVSKIDVDNTKEKSEEFSSRRLFFLGKKNYEDE